MTQRNNRIDRDGILLGDDGPESPHPDAVFTEDAAIQALLWLDSLDLLDHFVLTWESDGELWESNRES